MKTQPLFMIVLLLMRFMIPVNCQNKAHALTCNVSVAEDVKSSLKPEGRLIIYLTPDPNGRHLYWFWPHTTVGKHYIFARNYTSWDKNDTLVIKDSEGWAAWGRTGKISFDSIPEGTYYIQILWKQNFDSFGTNGEGNLWSGKQELVLNASQSIDIKLTEVINLWKPAEHPHVKHVQFKSDTLSKWWGKTVYEYAAVLLPSGYFENLDIEYPIYYFVGGGDSDCLEADRLMATRKRFVNRWMAEDAPQIITVFLDGVQNRNIYHLDSDNLGPHGYSLVNEFIPYIENQFRGTNTPDTRFIGGCSTGGYGSLALQLFYPETFNGVFCYSPDPISFREFFYINIYEDENFFCDEYDYPTMLNHLGRKTNPISWKDHVNYENVLGPSGSYLDSDHYFSVMSAISGPKGVNGLPIALVDPVTGVIDKKVAESWSRYDLSKYLADNWDQVGPALEGKIYISCNDMDSYFLDRGVRVFENTLNELENPSPQAVIEWAPGMSHCGEYNQMKVMRQIEERIKEIAQINEVKQN